MSHPPFILILMAVVVTPAAPEAVARFEHLVDMETRIASVMGVLNATSAELVSLLSLIHI